jgi:hypothetical protein
MAPVIRPFNLPYPRGATLPRNLGMLESPSPVIGQVVCAASTIDATGVSTRPESGSWSLPAKIALAAFIAFWGIVLIGLPISALLGYLLGQILSNAAIDAIGWGLAVVLAPPPILAAVFTFRFFIRRLGKGTKYGSCTYVGTDGVEVIFLEYGGEHIVRSAVRYIDDLVMLRSNTSDHINGIYQGEDEELRFANEKGSTPMVLSGSYHKAGAPSAEALCVREAAMLATKSRLERAVAKLGRGEPVVFPVFEDSDTSHLRAFARKAGRVTVPTSKRIVLSPHAIEIHDTSAAPLLQQRFARTEVALKVDAGQLAIVPRSGPAAGVAFPVSLVGDADVLMALARA